ncbi:MAG TPA: response regulator [Verrucomicrobiae bacterium]|jgi:two-component system response regulator|nr:response regulator [Verrucomicrobiae bacterium]
MMKKSEHILLAKDNEMEAMLVRRAIEIAGVKAGLHVVRDGQEAVDYLAGVNSFSDRVRHPFPKLMLLDLRMPRLDGFEVLGIVRNKLHFTRLPVIVLTNSENPADIKRAYELGATSYFCKPDSVEGLDEMIHVLHAYWLKFNHFPE